MQRVLVLSVSVAVITWAASGCGVAQPIQLNGTFQLSGSSTCINGEPDEPREPLQVEERPCARILCRTRAGNFQQ